MTDARNTQEALEMWGQGTPQAQLTQVVVEEWTSVTAGNSQALVTQVALEQWAVAFVVQVPSARVMVLA